MKLIKIENKHWKIITENNIDILECIIGFKQHFGLLFSLSLLNILSKNSNYPTFIINFFFISLIITLPYFKNDNYNHIYGFYFGDFKDKNWIPDFLNIHIYKYIKIFDFPWHIKLYNREYETKKIKSLKIKNIDNLKTKDTFKYSKIININNKDIEILYYKETIIYKYKIFKWFINKWSKKYYYFNIEFKENNKQLINDTIVFYEDKNIEEMLNEYLKKNYNNKEA